MRPRPQQLEFDLVSPHLAGPGQYQLAACGLDQDDKDTVLLKHIAAELDYQDLLEGPISPNPSTELGELQVLLGPIEWRQKRRWQRRVKKNVLAVRKVIIVLRNLLTAEKPKEPND